MGLSGFFGGDGEGETPVPIPNTVVKPLCADGTARVTGWESRAPPILNRATPGALERSGGVFRWGVAGALPLSLGMWSPRPPIARDPRARAPPYCSTGVAGFCLETVDGRTPPRLTRAELAC